MAARKRKDAEPVQTARQKRNALIKEEFQRRKAEGYRSAFIFEQLADKYFLSPARIEDIVYSRQSPGEGLPDI